MKNKVNVLLVDDSKRILDQLLEMLSEVENVDAIQTAQDAPAALALMKTTDYDVVVLDIQLPDANGIDILKWIKHMKPDTRVIMFSNLSDDCHRAAARMAGADHFFDKSNEFEEIPRVLSLLEV
jgi:DNA-binding NarL/FixJ family response regulator